MPTEFSPTLLDNDPKFEYEPSKFIDVDSPKWFEWLESNHSFRFTAGVGGENSYRARKELNKSQGVYYWYGVKKVDNKLHKKYIGKSNEVTHRRLIEVAEVIRQPSGKQLKDIDIQLTPQFEDRLKNLELLVQQLQKHDSPVVASQELTNLLDNRDKQLQELTNELTLEDSKLTELSNELANKDKELQELTNQVDNLNSNLTELTNELANKDRELQELKAAVPSSQPLITNTQAVELEALRERFLEIYRKSIKKGLGDERVVKMGELFDKALKE